MIKHKKLSPEYRRYLQSARWKALRVLALKLAGYKCQECGDDILLLVHHLKYTYKWRDEPVTDLNVLCLSCHYKVHKRPPKKWRQVKRIVVYSDGNFVEMENIKPFFAEMRKNMNKKGITRICTPGRFFSGVN